MTRPLSAGEVEARIREALPLVGVRGEGETLQVEKDSLLAIARFLKEGPGLEMEYLTNLTAVDYLDHFEVVYNLVSIKHNHSLVLKVRLPGRDNLEVPSVTPLWNGADLQEREVYDLLGISFPGHPNLKRVLLWEGFPGHPLRKDYI